MPTHLARNQHQFCNNGDLENVSKWAIEVLHSQDEERTSKMIMILNGFLSTVHTYILFLTKNFINVQKSDNLQYSMMGRWDDNMIVPQSDGPSFILIDWE